MSIHFSDLCNCFSFCISLLWSCMLRARINDIFCGGIWGLHQILSAANSCKLLVTWAIHGIVFFILLTSFICSPDSSQTCWQICGICETLSSSSCVCEVMFRVNILGWRFCRGGTHNSVILPQQLAFPNGRGADQIVVWVGAIEFVLFPTNVIY